MPGSGGIASRLRKTLATKIEEGAELEAIRHSITFRCLTLRPRNLEAGSFSTRGRPSFQ